MNNYRQGGNQMHQRLVHAHGRQQQPQYPQHGGYPPQGGGFNAQDILMRLSDLEQGMLYHNEVMGRMGADIESLMVNGGGNHTPSANGDRYGVYNQKSHGEDNYRGGESNVVDNQQQQPRQLQQPRDDNYYRGTTTDTKETSIPEFSESKIMQELEKAKGFSFEKYSAKLISSREAVNGIMAHKLPDNLNIATLDTQTREWDFKRVMSKDVKEAALTTAVIVNPEVVINRNVLERELMCPPEALALVMKRLSSTSDDIETLLFITTLNRVLTNVMNDYVQINVGDINVNSYMDEVGTFQTLLRDIDIEAADTFMVNFNIIVDEIVRGSYLDLPQVGEDGKVPMVKFNTQSKLLLVNYHSVFMAIPDNIGYDKFKEFDDLSTQENAFPAIIARLIKRSCGAGKTLYMTTKDKRSYKFMLSNDEKLHIKRFDTFF